MKTRYDHVRFIKTCLDPMWNCLDNATDALLGSVFWGLCNKISFNPEEDAEFGSPYLRDIADFMDQFKVT